MLAKFLQVNVVSQEGSVYEAKALEINLRGSEGELGVTYGHTQLLSTLPPGVVRITRDNNDIDTLYISGGSLEVQPHQVIILSDVIERATELNEAVIKEARAQAQAIISQTKKMDKIEIEEARTKLAESEARLRALKSMKGISVI